jgi:hypothetical protein
VGAHDHHFYGASNGDDGRRPGRRGRVHGGRPRSVWPARSLGWLRATRDRVPEPTPAAAAALHGTAAAAGPGA